MEGLEARANHGPTGSSDCRFLDRSLGSGGWGRLGCAERRRGARAALALAREHGIAGATMLRGLMGYGATSRIHTAKILRLSEDLPVVVEIVDSPEKIAAFLPTVESMVRGGLVTLERVQVIRYAPDAAPH